MLNISMLNISLLNISVLQCIQHFFTVRSAIWQSPNYFNCPDSAGGKWTCQEFEQQQGKRQDSVLCRLHRQISRLAYFELASCLGFSIANILVTLIVLPLRATLVICPQTFAQDDIISDLRWFCFESGRRQP